MPEILRQMLDQEGLQPLIVEPICYRSNLVLNTAIGLFGHILDTSDERWRIAEAASRAFYLTKGVTVHCALYEAIYLSPNKRSSFASEFSRLGTSPENLRQAARSIHNANATETYSKVNAGGIKIKRVVTTKITHGYNPDHTTGCPEALHQFQMFCKGKYVGRVGFNVHQEEGQKVVTIANIQGSKGGRYLLDQAQEILGVPPLNYLVLDLKERYPDATFLGVRNPKHAEAAPLQNTVLRKTDVRQMSFKR